MPIRKHLLTTKEVAAYLDKKPKTISVWVQRGILTPYAPEQRAPGEQNLFDVNEVTISMWRGAKIIGIDESTVRAWTKEGRLPTPLTLGAAIRAMRIREHGGRPERSYIQPPSPDDAADPKPEVPPC